MSSVNFLFYSSRSVTFRDAWRTMLRITFINVGYGDSILLEEFEASKRTFAMLVDGGSPYDGEYRSVYDAHPDRSPPFRYLVQHGIDKLDIIFMTHFHIDHIGGIPAVMRSIPFGEVWTNYRLPAPLPHWDKTSSSLTKPESMAMHRSLELLEDMGSYARAYGNDITTISNHRFGESLTRDTSADIYTVKPNLAMNMDLLVKRLYDGTADESESALYALDKSQNASCTALRIAYKGRSVLLTADLPYTYWDPLIDEGHSIQADILKFSHHGHDDGASPKFADKVAPSHVVFCVSTDNPFGCPKPSALSSFTGDVRFHATGNINMPPALAPTLPHRAVIFEISAEGDLRWKTETAGLS